MIKEEKVLVRINLRNQKKYIDKGYNFDKVKMGESKEIEVNISDMPKGSHIRITAICDICGSENSLTINKYYVNYNRNDKGYYSCFNCKTKEHKKTCIRKYGVDSYSKTDEFKKFISENNDYELIHEKVKKTNLERYGVEHYFQTEEVREINRKWMSSDEFSEKTKKYMLDNYGVDHYSKTDEFKNKMSINKDIIINKIKETFLDRYGVDWYSKSDDWKKKYKDKYNEIREKVVSTCLDKYGVDNVSKVDFIMKKVMKTKVENGTSIDNSLLSDWEIYKKRVNSLTRKVKKQLYEQWDGYDYYDGEYIKDNMNLSSNNKNYPTIDHKISVFYGFSNNISPEEISKLENLCITKRWINSKKHRIIEEKFEI